MNMQSGEAPFLFDWKWYQIWTGQYEKFYQQKGGWMAGLVLFSFNLQFGMGRNSFTLTILNFGFTASWNARRVSKVVEMPTKGPHVTMKCVCGKNATAMLPVCEDCAASLLTAANTADKR